MKIILIVFHRIEFTVINTFCPTWMEITYFPDEKSDDVNCLSVQLATKYQQDYIPYDVIKMDSFLQ